MQTTIDRTTSQPKTLGDHGFSYAACLATSEKIHWRVEDVIGGDKALDFSRRFLPESFARVERLSFLSADEQRLLNQIRAYGYVQMFIDFEAFITPWVLDHARAEMNGDDAKVRALLFLTAEEAKHTDLFHRFTEAFESGFGSPCEAIGPADEIAAGLAQFHPVACALTVLMGEWSSQRHYTEAVKDDASLDHVFKDMLRHHWMDESQHARLDTLLLEEQMATLDREEIAAGCEAFLDVLTFFDDGMKEQVRMDLASLERATGRALDEAERVTFLDEQLQAWRWTFLGSAMLHPKFLATVEALDTDLWHRLVEIAPQYC